MFILESNDRMGLPLGSDCNVSSEEGVSVTVDPTRLQELVDQANARPEEESALSPQQ